MVSRGKKIDFDQISRHGSMFVSCLPFVKMLELEFEVSTMMPLLCGRGLWEGFYMVGKWLLIKPKNI